MRTIAAISTPRGKGGVSLIRISGDEAIRIAERVTTRSLSDVPANKTVHTLFSQDGKPFDDGMATVFYGPRSFTGEDTVELCCHGGLFVTQKLLSAVYAAGAYPAGPGEFTRRAFQNGKLSLSQAEAVGGIIDAKTERCLTVSLLQCTGSLSAKLSSMSDRLKALIASVYAFIDYPDEDMTDVSVEELRARLQTLLSETEALCRSHNYGKAISEGIRTVIVGKPNTGKSALLNLLAGEERAIVTDIAGTTRDVVREQVKLGDLLLNLSDTAGLRETEDTVEKIGVRRSLEALDGAELVFAVFDGSSPLDEQDEEVLRLIREHGKEAVTVCILNKSDLGEQAVPPFADAVRVSAVRGTGLDALESAVREKCELAESTDDGEIITGARQFAALSKVKTHLTDALRSLDGFTQDLAGLDMEQALGALYEADGREVSEEIVSEIFSHFCVGK